MSSRQFFFEQLKLYLDQLQSDTDHGHEREACVPYKGPHTNIHPGEHSLICSFLRTPMISARMPMLSLSQIFCYFWCVCVCFVVVVVAVVVVVVVVCVCVCVLFFIQLYYSFSLAQ